MSRYLFQYLLPLALLALVVFLGRNVRKSAAASETEHDRSMFLLIFMIGAAVALVLGILFYQYLET
ncbi:MAG: hypothetical protein AAGG11_14020 [Pseudomonadota bacterium]